MQIGRFKCEANAHTTQRHSADNHISLSTLINLNQSRFASHTRNIVFFCSQNENYCIKIPGRGPWGTWDLSSRENSWCLKDIQEKEALKKENILLWMGKMNPSLMHHTYFSRPNIATLPSLLSSWLLDQYIDFDCSTKGYFIQHEAGCRPMKNIIAALTSTKWASSGDRWAFLWHVRGCGETRVKEHKTRVPGISWKGW